MSCSGSAGRMSACALQRQELLRILALGGAIFTSWLRHAVTAFLYTFLGSCGGHKLVLQQTAATLGCIPTVQGCAVTDYFPADGQRASGWSRSTWRRSTCGQSLASAPNLPCGEPPSVCARASRSSRSKSVDPRTPRSEANE